MLIESREKGNVFWIVLNRPEKANAINHTMWRGLAAKLDEGAKSHDSRVIALTGSGRFFSAGEDITDLSGVTTFTAAYDLFIGIPIHRAPAALADTGLAVNNWVPVDQSNLRTRFGGVYALGDVCTGPRTVPKAGIFAEAAARVVADDIAATIAGAEPPPPYEGSGVCYAEFGGGLVSKVEVNFLRGDAPDAKRHDPSLEYAAEKEEFGAVRRARWFGRP